jgi:hypothetical protein
MGRQPYVFAARRALRCHKGAAPRTGAATTDTGEWGSTHPLPGSRLSYPRLGCQPLPPINALVAVGRVPWAWTDPTQLDLSRSVVRQRRLGHEQPIDPSPRQVRCVCPQPTKPADMTTPGRSALASAARSARRRAGQLYEPRFRGAQPLPCPKRRRPVLGRSLPTGCLPIAIRSRAIGGCMSQVGIVDRDHLLRITLVKLAVVGFDCWGCSLGCFVPDGDS